ncbi:PREDICTED: uncharacterized protein LOC109114694 [Nelumbo nucifera]|uniref:Uncharacterized protein LOC109114694 n=1 Tax=Nelumbo nucifera TaxID=4432 RepID=A0A1U8Q383_NELNU|nr:PREDICTED: uncharacterized protein LOC109114694 [Nelumbo nucifera]
MIIPEKNCREISKYLFQEDVCYAKKGFNLAKHPKIDVPNLQCTRISCAENNQLDMASDFVVTLFTHALTMGPWYTAPIKYHQQETKYLRLEVISLVLNRLVTKETQSVSMHASGNQQLVGKLNAYGLIGQPSFSEENSGDLGAF